MACGVEIDRLNLVGLHFGHGVHGQRADCHRRAGGGGHDGGAAAGRGGHAGEVLAGREGDEDVTDLQPVHLQAIALLGFFGIVRRPALAEHEERVLHR